jgi:hypothetical protein
MLRFSLAGTLAIVVALAACSRVLPGGPPTPAPWRGISADARLYTDNAGGIQDSVRMTVRDETTLRQYWQMATQGQAPPPAVPSVDFAREMVLVVAAGRRSLQDEIRVDSVRTARETDASGRTAQVMSAMVRLVEGCGRSTTPGYPVQIIRVPRFDGRVSFTERRERATC